jgi:hypothetical protein
MSGVYVVLMADILHWLHAGLPGDLPSDCPGRAVGAGIVDGGLVMQDVLVETRVALDDVQLPGVRMTGGVKPGAVVESSTSTTKVFPSQRPTEWPK